MTYREKLQKEHPEKVSDYYFGGCADCPGTCGYGPERCGNKHCTYKCADCWNKEYKGEKEMATVNSFKKEDIKAGYVIRLRNGDCRTIFPVGKEGTLIAMDSTGVWSYLSQWNSDFKYTGRIDEFDSECYDIISVYGYVHGTHNYHQMFRTVQIDNRPLLWKRTEAKKMTVAEINAALGYEVEIVAEKE